MNHMIHIAAATQIRLDTPGRAYYRRKLAAGKTRAEAMRCLKRRISDALYRQLRADAKTAAARVEAGPGGHRGASHHIQRGRLAPAHRHFGSATSRTRTNDATRAHDDTEDHDPETPPTRPLTSEGCRRDAPWARLAELRSWRDVLVCEGHSTPPWRTSAESDGPNLSPRLVNWRRSAQKSRSTRSSRPVMLLMSWKEPGTSVSSSGLPGVPL